MTMERRPEVSAISDGTTIGIVINIFGDDGWIMCSRTQAEDIAIQLGSVLNTLKGVEKKLPLRDRLRALRG